MSRRYRVLSYGAGVQTVAMARLVLAGQLPRPDLVIFADTQNEPRAVYETVARERAACEEHGLEFMVLTGADLADWRGNGSIHTPLYTVNLETGEQGQLYRTCTDRFKIQPIRQELRRRGWDEVDLWLGITVDEVHRAKHSQVQWITNCYPFLELNFRRGECERFLELIAVPASKSACVFCPYRSPYGWSVIRSNPEDWAKAVAYDESIRHARPGFLSFVHSDCKPLAEAVPDPSRQTTLFGAILGDQECGGFCAA